MASMKFSLLPIGQRFRYQGKEYLKISPLQAQLPDGSGRRLIPRSAVVEPLEADDGEAPPPTPREIPLPELAQAMDRLGAEIADIVTASGLDAAGVERTLGAIRKAFLRARRSLRID